MHTLAGQARDWGARTRCRRPHPNGSVEGGSQRADRANRKACVEETLRCAVKTGPDSAMDFGGGFERSKKRLPRPPPPGATPPRRSLGGSVIQNYAQRQRYSERPRRTQSAVLEPPSCRALIAHACKLCSTALTTPLDRPREPTHRGARRSARESTRTSIESRAETQPVEHSVNAPQSARTSVPNNGLQSARQVRVEHLEGSAIRPGDRVRERCSPHRRECSARGGHPVEENRGFLSLCSKTPQRTAFRLDTIERHRR